MLARIRAEWVSSTEIPRERTITLHLPDLGSARRNGQLDALMHEFARRLVAILQDEK